MPPCIDATASIPSRRLCFRPGMIRSESVARFPVPGASAFSSEMDTGSREENATNKELKLRL